MCIKPNVCVSVCSLLPVPPPPKVMGGYVFAGVGM